MYERATRLEDVYKTLSPEPLRTKGELDAFYRDAVNSVRGGSRIDHIELGLQRAHGGASYKAFLMGHPGVGKSTELSRLIEKVKLRFRAVRFSVLSELDAGAFEPFDVLLLMMIRLAEEAAKPVEAGGAGQPPSEKLLKEIWGWFATETTLLRRQTEIGVHIAAGLGAQGDSWWGKVAGLFADVKGELRYASVRQQELVDYRLERMSRLVELVNRVAAECNEHLRTACAAEWLVVGEDLDKPIIPVAKTEALFLTYGSLFGDLDLHLIFSLPISLAYSSKAASLPLPHERIHCIRDTPVFARDHAPDERGRRAVGEVLAARVTDELFEESQLQRLIVASGGNLRDLFSLVMRASDNALVASRSRVGSEDAAGAISGLKTEYERRLGESPHDDERVPYEEKADKLVAIYDDEPSAGVPDATLHALLRARAVQEFNGEGWFGVHPLVVDILEKQGRLKPQPGEDRVRGGTGHA